MATLRLTESGVRVHERAVDEEITLDAWREGVRPEAGRFALRIPNDADIAGLSEIIVQFQGVVLEFPSFRDGRAFSQARTLRERFRFRGEIRAAGAVLCDQALFLARCGFDAIDIGDRDVEGFRKALSAFSHFHQPAADGAAPIRSLRARRAKAA